MAPHTLDVARMSPLWAAPFVGVLLTIAVAPLFAARWWHPHYGKAALFWALAAVAPIAWTFGAPTAAASMFKTMATEYLPFVAMLFALFTTAGGLVLRGGATGSPLSNTLVLAVGAVLANVVGTMGAAMVLVRPLLRANAARTRKAHVAVFFIFVVANIGGALTPLGDPPLFLGFLRGVDFFWPTRALLAPTGFAVGALLALFYVVDRWLWSREAPRAPALAEPFAIEGKVNLALVVVAAAAIAASGVWSFGPAFAVWGADLEWRNIARDAVLLCVGLASIALTDARARRDAGFEWAPFVEVAILFAAIFVCLTPVAAMLAAGRDGPFDPLIALTRTADGAANNAAIFWLSGALSAFLDSAPAYLVFFDAAGGDAGALMGPRASTLAAISLGTVFMGAVTYIGNAPNFVVYAIARDSGAEMPGFFGYLAWSAAVLFPLFLATTALFIR